MHSNKQKFNTIVASQPHVKRLISQEERRCLRS